MSISKCEALVCAKPWGGEKLKKMKNLESKDPIGETWEVSIVNGFESKIKGKKLNEKFSKIQIPYLIKFIDTSDYLSVQVHPNDEQANRLEQAMGKTECWVILEAQSGAGIYLGVKEGVDRKTLAEAIANDSDLSTYLNFYEVKPGQFFYVPAGTIHAIGKNILIAEIQQSSGITYRLWDWKRFGLDGKKRELHVDKALEVACFDKVKNDLSYFKFKKNIFDKEEILVEHKDFKVKSFQIKDSKSLKIVAGPRAQSIIVLSGEGEINGQCYSALDTFILESTESSLRFSPKERSCFLWVY